MEPKPIRVLLIEDTPADAEVMQEALSATKGFAFDLTHVDRVSAGLKVLADQAVDVVLLDLVLPDSKGLETLITVRREVPRVPIVVLTASDDDVLAVEALQRGAQDYLVKGYVQVYRDLLGRAIRYAIERHRAERLKDEFVSTVSHELRTPLATIREFTSILDDEISGPLGKDQHEYLAIIKTNVERLTRMIDNLLDMAKIEAGQIILNKEVIETGILLDHIVQTVRPLADNKRIHLELRVPPTLPNLYADVDKVTQICINLISNAIKFTPEGGRITVRAAEGPNDVEMAVQDTGIGIPEEDQPKLFEKFQQVHAQSVSGGAKGTGLGLAISKRLVELHGGRIWVESRPRQGSTFAFALPKYHAEELFHDLFAHGIERAKQRKGRISLVVLSVRNFEALTARHGADEAARLVREVEGAVKGSVRRRDGGDILVKWRRSELALILSETDGVGAKAMAARVMRMLEGQTFAVGDQPVEVTVAPATTTYPDDGASEAELLRVAEARLQNSHGPRVRVMVVDDEPKIRQLIKQTLETQDFDVFTAASGPDALEQLRGQAVDLVLLDLMMPVMDGYEVYHLLKEDRRTKDIPVIIVTAKGERKDRQLGLNSPSYHYMTKPFEMGELVAKVRDVLAQAPSQ